MKPDVWIKSSKCTSATNCVEVKLNSDTGIYCVRSTKEPRKILFFTTEEWAAFTEGVKAGEFEV